MEVGKAGGGERGNHAAVLFLQILCESTTVTKGKVDIKNIAMPMEGQGLEVCCVLN